MNNNVDIKALRNEFEGDEKLQEEFGAFENYLSYIQAGAGEFVSDPAYSFSDRSEDVALETTKFDEGSATDDLLKEHFSKTQELQDEFGDAASYCAFVHGQRWRAERAKGLSDRSGATGNFNETATTDDELKEHFAKTQQVQDEFGDTDSYLSYVHGQKRCAERETRLSERHEEKKGRGKMRAELVGQTQP